MTEYKGSLIILYYLLYHAYLKALIKNIYIMKRNLLLFLAVLVLSGIVNAQVTFTVTDTKQDTCYDEKGNVISFPSEGEDFYGQDAQYEGIQPSYTDNDDGTVTDNNTGLIWQRGYVNTKTQYDDAIDYCNDLSLAGYDDWRLPTIKELYSLSDWRGEIVNGSASLSTPYIDETYFDFDYTSAVYAGQYWSITKYLVGGVQPENLQVAFGFNFADGHIKGYETGYYFDGSSGASAPGNYLRCVRGEENVYGVNDFQGNKDGTVTDNATGLMWTKGDNGSPVDWENALLYCENLDKAGYQDWRLPNIKELQSIVDYDKTSIPVADSIFNFTDDDSWFWSSTSHGDSKDYACYICFGKAYSKENSGASIFYDWHGAGAMRSDPKYGNYEDWLSQSENATDSVRVDNYARCVRNTTINTTAIEQITLDEVKAYPNPSKGVFYITTEQPYTIVLTDINGKQIFSSSTKGGTVSLDLSGYKNGIYLVRCITDESARTLKLIKN